jgi:NAD(P)-dependent dehydrogenase (short-subunit alcohol dehydrogenase family)
VDIKALFDLSGKTAVIAGGGGALGSAVGVGLSQAGAQVIIIDINAKNAEVVVEKIREAGGKAHYFSGDLSKEEIVEDIFSRIDGISSIDVLVNAVSAPLGRPSPDKMSLETWEGTIAVNLTSFFLTSRAAAQRMIKAGKGGSIINFGSIAGISALGRGAVAYGAAKAAIGQMTRDCSFEWAQYGIRVNSILPGQFVNDFWDKLLNDPSKTEFVKRVTNGMPIGRFGEPHEIVGPVLFLASEASSMVTGIALPVDGGNLAMNPGATLEF